MSPKSQPPTPKLYPERPGFIPATAAMVGGVLSAEGSIDYNVDRPTVRLKVRNTGDRPIQVGSHFHFFEVNRYLEFERGRAFGCHLNIPATTAIRFEPGDEREVELVPYGGKCRVVGFNNLTDGYAGGEESPCYYPVRIRALKRAAQYGFKGADAEP